MINNDQHFTILMERTQHFYFEGDEQIKKMLDRMTFKQQTT